MGLRGELLVAIALVGACGGQAAPSDAGAPRDLEAEGRALLSVEPFPARAEALALVDALAVTSAREGESPKALLLEQLAATLREKMYRVDRSEADAREAIELYGSFVKRSPDKEAACEADRRRALLRGEIAGGAHATFREVFLAKRRHAALPDADKSSCLRALAADLQTLTAFRPQGEAYAALVTEGDKAFEGARSSEPRASASASALAAPSTAPLGSIADVVVAPPASAPKGPTKITKIEKYAAEGGGRVVIHLSGPAHFEVGALAKDPTAGKDARIFIDIDKATQKGIAKEIAVGGAVRRVRLAPRDGGSRVVLDLAAEMHRRVFYLPEPFRIVVDVSSRPIASEEKSASDAGGAREVRRIVVDPGHGGDDAGAVGPTGLKEKDVTLDIAHRVAPILAHELKIETMLTRDRDVFVPLDERAARANAFHADLFISIHCNASENGEARGIETFVLDELKDVSRAASRVAALENGLKGTLDPASLDAEMGKIFGGLRSGETAARSRHLGGLIAKGVLGALTPRFPDTKDHGIKSAGFYVLAGAEMPAVLFETSFISNPVDESRLATADYRQKLADGLINAIRAFREGK